MSNHSPPFWDEPPSLHDAKIYDAEMLLGSDRIDWTVLAGITRGLDYDDDRRFHELLHNVISLRATDVKGRAHLAANEMREFLARQYIKEKR